MDNQVKIGVFFCACGHIMNDYFDMKALLDYAGRIPGVMNVDENRFLCTKSGFDWLKTKVIQSGCNRVVIAGCTPLLYEQSFMKVMEEAGLNRYLFEELWRTLFKQPPAILSKFWVNSGLSIAFMLLLAVTNGYKMIWPLFGATNQLLAALTLIAVTIWLHVAGKKSWFTLIPAVIMMLTTIGALTYTLFVKYLPDGNIALVTTNLILLLLAVGVIVLAFRRFFQPSARPGSFLSS